MNVFAVPLSQNTFSMSALLGGARGVNTLAHSLANGGDMSFLNGHPLKERLATFMSTVVNQVTDSAEAIGKATKKVFQRDYVRPLVSFDDLKNIPPCMHLPIVYYKPIRESLEDGLIDGFGIDPKTLASRDIYEEVLKSGFRDDLTTDDFDKNGEIYIHFHWSTEDPELTHEEVEAIRDTRAYYDKFSTDPKTKHLDFTDCTSLHG